MLHAVTTGLIADNVSKMMTSFESELRYYDDEIYVNIVNTIINAPYQHQH